MTTQINAIIAAERRADARRVAAGLGTARRPLGRWLRLSPPRVALTPVALECCA